MKLHFLDTQNKRQGSIDIDPNKTPPLGRGGASVVYQNPANAQEVVRVYQPLFLSKHGNLKPKIQAMLSFPPGNEEVFVASRLWPTPPWQGQKVL
ncbi:hypothetical protein CCP3SC1AL1_1800007 [Gammaproteobacteria bacterium]